MKLNTAFKLSALAAAITFSTGSFAVDTFSGDIEVAGDIIADGGILVSGDSLVGGDIVADGNIEIAGNSTVGGKTTLNGLTTINNDTTVNGFLDVNGVDAADTPITPTTVDSTISTQSMGNPNSSVDIAYKDIYSKGVQTETKEQIVTSDKVQLNSSIERKDQERIVDKTATANYNNDGEFTGIDNVTTVSDTGYVTKKSEVISEDTIVMGREDTGSENAFTVRKTEDKVTTEAKITASDVSLTGKDADGNDISSKLTANGLNTTGTVKAQSVEADTVTAKDVNADTVTAKDVNADTVTATDVNADTFTAKGKDAAGNDISSILNAEGLTTTGQVTAKDVTASGTVTAQDVKATDVTATGTVSAAKITLGGKDLQETLTAEETARKAADVVLQNNINAEEKARTDADALLDGRISTNTDNISKNTTAIAGFDSRISDLNTRTNQLNKRVDDVEKTAYRGVAIALAAQQNVPNIKPGQFAVFGGVGHYESESAFAMGVVGSINERTSISGAIGVAGGSEVGGRVGVAYVFGGK